jgi:hypothetical protein
MGRFTTRVRHIGDSAKWKDHDAYSKAFARLMGDLQNEPTGATVGR